MKRLLFLTLLLPFLGQSQTYMEETTNNVKPFPDFAVEYNTSTEENLNISLSSNLELTAPASTATLSASIDFDKDINGVPTSGWVIRATWVKVSGGKAVMASGTKQRWRASTGDTTLKSFTLTMGLSGLEVGSTIFRLFVVKMHRIWVDNDNDGKVEPTDGDGIIAANEYKAQPDVTFYTKEVVIIVHKSTNAFAANAGNDSVIFKNQSLPADTGWLVGLWTKGTPTSVLWEKYDDGTVPNGTNASFPGTIENPTSLKTRFLNPDFGTHSNGKAYTFKLTVSNGVTTDVDYVTLRFRNLQLKNEGNCRPGYNTVTKTGGVKFKISEEYIPIKTDIRESDGKRIWYRKFARETYPSTTYINRDLAKAIAAPTGSSLRVSIFENPLTDGLVQGGDTIVLGVWNKDYSVLKTTDGTNLTHPQGQKILDSLGNIFLGDFGGNMDLGCPVYIVPDSTVSEIHNAWIFFALEDSNVIQSTIWDGKALVNRKKQIEDWGFKYQLPAQPYGFFVNNHNNFQYECERDANNACKFLNGVEVPLKDANGYIIYKKDKFGDSVGYKRIQNLGAMQVSNWTVRGYRIYNGGLQQMKIYPSDKAWLKWDKFNMKNVTIEDCFFDKVAVEGGYVGNTAPGGGQDYDIYGWMSQGSKAIVRNSVFMRTGWDGIQIANARNGSEVISNFIWRSSRSEEHNQTGGILYGGLNGEGKIEKNVVINNRGMGLEIHGYGDISVYHNYIDSVGSNSLNPGKSAAVYLKLYEAPWYATWYGSNWRFQKSIFKNNVFGRAEASYIRVGDATGNKPYGRTPEYDNNKVIDHPNMTVPFIADNAGYGELGTNWQRINHATPVVKAILPDGPTGVEIYMSQGGDPIRKFTSIQEANRYLVQRAFGNWTEDNGNNNGNNNPGYYFWIKKKARKKVYINPPQQ